MHPRVLRFVRTFSLSSAIGRLSSENILLTPFPTAEPGSVLRLLYRIFFLSSVFFFILTGCSSSDASLRINSFSGIRTHFTNPPAKYRTAPLWVWNDDMTEAQITEQLTDFKDKGFGGVFVHPRPGLITPYLSEQWFDLFRYSVETGKELGLYVWIYDENSYPSGFAGGHVPAEMPESYNHGQGLTITECSTLPDNAKDYFIILKQAGEEFRNITTRLDAEKGEDGPYYLFEKTFYGKSGWYGGYSYVDLMLNGVTEKFIKLTMTGYEKAASSELGRTVPGVFTDEPHIGPPQGIRWTPALFEAFEKRWGYDLITHLPSLWLETGDWKQVRHNYYSVLLELFIERWSKPWNAYCEKQGLKWTGHYWEHDWPNPSGGPDNMAMYAWHQVPGIDILMNQYSESVHAQFGNIRAVKELGSIANQLGKEQTLSETYGASGWDLTFEDMKRIADWEYVFGVNFINQHLSYVTIKGARKNDHPLSFSYHEPWWPYYKNMNDYAARMTLAMMSGRQMNRVLVMEPTTTAWMYYSDKPNQTFSNLGQRFQDFIFELERHHIEYDLGSEDIIARNGKTEGAEFAVGERNYTVVVLPPGMENVNTATFGHLQKFLEGGGLVVSFCGIPPYIDGSTKEAAAGALTASPGKWIAAEGLDEAARLLAPDDFRIETIQGNVSHHRRILEDGQLVLLVNSDKSKWARGTLQTGGKSAFLLDAASGEINDYPVKQHGPAVELAFELPPVGGMLLFIDASAQPADITDQEVKIQIIQATCDMSVRRLQPNALRLDYCDLEFDDGPDAEGIYYFHAVDRIFKHFGLDGNPWNRAVQYKTNILDLDTFPENTGFTATFPFYVAEGTVLHDLKAVVEQPGLWSVSVNGKKVLPVPGAWWLDRDFGVYEIGALVHSGKNLLSVHADRMTIHSELESVFLTGDFSLQSRDAGWTLVSPAPLKPGWWNIQGMPFYAQGVEYVQTMQVDTTDSRYLLFLPAWKGVMAHVTVNNKDAGIIGWNPAERDVTDFITNGENTVSVTVYGSLKNLLGPHHGSPTAGAAWPGNFEFAPPSQPPGTAYDVRGYGLQESFQLIGYSGPVKPYYTMEFKTADAEILSASRIIRDRPLEVEMRSSTPGAEIFFTRDGSEPGSHSERYVKSLQLSRNTTIKALAVKEGRLPGNVVTAQFEKVNFRNATYGNAFSFKYSAGGEHGLYDGVRGTGGFNDGCWQGFEAENLDVTLELLQPQTVRTISAGFLQDIGSWIYFPVAVTFYVSRDGEHFSQAARLTTRQIAQFTGDRIKNLTAQIEPREVSHIRVKAENIKVCPKGDPGEGGRAWIFVDELTVE